jgi:hypothetical protein
MTRPSAYHADLLTLPCPQGGEEKSRFRERSNKHNNKAYRGDLYKEQGVLEIPQAMPKKLLFFRRDHTLKDLYRSARLLAFFPLVLLGFICILIRGHDRRP